MKICYLADAGSIHTQRWVNYFAGKGHEVHLVSFRAAQRGLSEGVILHVLGGVALPWRPLSFAARLLPQTLETGRLLRSVKPDILHSHFITSYGLIGALTGFHPIVASPWGSDVLTPPATWKLFRPGVRCVLKKADLVLTTSEYLKKHVHTKFSIPESHVKAIPWGVDLATFHRGYEAGVRTLKSELQIRDDDCVILSPRHFKPLYRIERILEALRYALDQYARLTLILLKGAGQDEEYERRIHDLVSTTGVKDSVRIVRRELTPGEMAIVYNASDALISIPMTDGGFSSCIQEGMACGTTPIVAQLEVYRQYLVHNHNALFVDGEDPRQIADAMVHCARKPEVKTEFYRINISIIEDKENWDKNARRVEALYENLLGSKPG